MLRARERGVLLRDEADYQLHVIYLWYEKQPRRALDLLDAAARSPPDNPLFPQLIAQVQDVYLHDLTGQPPHVAIAARCRARAYASRIRTLAEVRARLGMAMRRSTA